MSKCLKGLAFRWVLVVVTLTVATGPPASGFVLDAHYYATYVLSSSTCFDWDESHLIASGAFQLDRNKSTKAEINPRRQYNKINWHAFTHDQARLNELWRRALKEPDPRLQLIKLGQFLHYVQDWESHATFPATIGHAIPSVMGRDPDSMAQDVERTARMIQGTLDHLSKMCVYLDRVPPEIENPDQAIANFYAESDMEALIIEIIESSDPAWRSKLRGKITRRGREIVQKNREHAEHFVAQHLSDHPAAGIPEDFEPGNPEKGIPDSLVLRLDKDGNLMHSVQAALDGSLDTDPFTDWDDGAWFEITKVAEIENGVRIDLVLRNHEPESTPKGAVTMVAVDVPTEAVVAQATAQLPRVKPGGRIERTFELVASQETEEYLIGLAFDYPNSPELSSEVWIMTQDDLRALAEDLASGEIRETGSAPIGELRKIEFLGEPEVWMMVRGLLCVDIEARTNLNDPTEELPMPEVFLVGKADFTTPPLEGRVDTARWSVAAQLEGDKAGASTFDCYDPRDQICGLSGEEYEPELEVMIKAEDFAQRIRVTVPEKEMEELREACRRAAGPESGQGTQNGTD